MNRPGFQIHAKNTERSSTIRRNAGDPLEVLNPLKLEILPSALCVPYPNVDVSRFRADDDGSIRSNSDVLRRESAWQNTQFERPAPRTWTELNFLRRAQIRWGWKGCLADELLPSVLCGGELEGEERVKTSPLDDKTAMRFSEATSLAIWDALIACGGRYGWISKGNACKGKLKGSKLNAGIDCWNIIRT